MTLQGFLSLIPVQTIAQRVGPLPLLQKDRGHPSLGGRQASPLAVLMRIPPSQVEGCVVDAVLGAQLVAVRQFLDAGRVQPPLQFVPLVRTQLTLQHPRHPRTF